MLVAGIKRLLYRNLSLEKYLRTVSSLFFAGYRLGLGRMSAAYEYPRFLKRLVREGDVVLDIGANLGYYSRVLSGLVGDNGKVYAVEPVKPILGVLEHNLRRCGNVEIVPFALGAKDKPILMVNDSSRYTGYMGTGRNYIPESDEDERADADMEFEVEMRRGSKLFADFARLDFVKCDIEGYEAVVIPEMASVIEKHLPVVLLETGGANRRAMIELFRRWGYAGYVLVDGRLVSVMRAPENRRQAESKGWLASLCRGAKEENERSEVKDVIFIPGHRHKEIMGNEN